MGEREPEALGIDAGSLFLKLATIDSAGRLVGSAALPHRGGVLQALREALPSLVDGRLLRAAVTGALAPVVEEALGVERVDDVRARIAGVLAAAGGARNIIDVGGATATLIRLDEGGRLEGLSTNPLCAAGTGSFLDEQLSRLGLRYDEIEDIPVVEEPPRIASRCAVFARSDLVHHQQAGRSPAECWSGLCQGTVQALLSAVSKGRPITGPTVLIGGVALNPHVVRFLSARLGKGLRTIPDGHLAAAVGAARVARSTVDPERLKARVAATRARPARPSRTRRALRLERSVLQQVELEEERRDDAGNELRVTGLPRGCELPCFLGVDIGSTSCKAVMAGVDGRVLCDVYRSTSGDPIAATRRLLAALADLAAARGVRFDVRGCGTTGSGRRMVGLVVGADAIVNEISCHVAGALHHDPRVETIFEIGGQDSKYMRVAGGRIVDASMNYVCAAGTGAFIEEQARKLGFAVDEIGRRVMGVVPPHTSERCTVFMEDDVKRLLREGFAREQAMAAVLYSVAQNYLNKVVAGRPRSSQRVFFQGATARNAGLVAAFEDLLGTEIVVTPYAHVMGAWGAALRARRAVGESGGATRFRGLALAGRQIALTSERCGQCANACEITSARIEGERARPAWGSRCGREAGQPRRESRGLRLVRQRADLLERTGRVDLRDGAPTVAVPRALTIHSHLPLWRRFLGELGFGLELTPPTDNLVRDLGCEVAGAEFCFPVKLALGHAVAAAERAGTSPVLIPHMISAAPSPCTSNAHFCPLVQAFPSLVKSALGLRGGGRARLLSPVVDLRWPRERQLRQLCRSVGAGLGGSSRQIRRAWLEGVAAQREFEAACAAAGARVLDEVAGGGEPAALVVGRPYTVYDPSASLGLVARIAESGRTVIPADCLPFDPAELGEEYRNLFWHYPQRIIAALKRLAGRRGIVPIYLTSFNCGPDSFVVSYAESVNEGRPMLVLSLDEHDADAGYATRIEAFLDSVEGGGEARTSAPAVRLRSEPACDFLGRTLWFPQMHYPGARLLAAAFRRFGYDARTLPLETPESHAVGRGLMTGGECLPAAATLGAFVSALREDGCDPARHALFMPTASGPCRFGQFAHRFRLVLDTLGWTEAAIMAPSSLNTYQGIPEALRRTMWRMMVGGDILLKARCKVAPYERNEGDADRVLSRRLERIEEAVASGGDDRRAWLEALEALAAVPTAGARRPLVGIVGEIYVRCNAFTNQNVVAAIERAGGEAWLTPTAEWILYTSYLQRWRADEDLRGLVFRGRSLVRNLFFKGVERELYRAARAWVGDREEPDISEVVDAGLQYLPLNFEGEAILTVGRAVRFARDGASLVVNCAPFGCMAGSASAALLQEVESRTGVPMVSLFYDGAGDLNRVLEAYIGQGLRRGGPPDGPGGGP
ncbi:MAG TPA: acyl-CoA dehydratase activase [Thermoanaerobaculales bacterium]|nr:acyl-CoA dehydratase activase [Thermoanaerobaculales bacterium]HQL30226.1 acyl-CoA dehydratase activase [Thermoanaerobaculales bacterium]